MEELLELVAAWSQGRPNRRAAPGIAARPAALLSRTIREPALGLPGAALDRCNDRRIALYGLRSPRERGRPSPKGGDARRSSPPGQLLRGECHPLSDRLAAPAVSLASLPQRSGPDWPLSSRSHDKRDSHGGNVVVVGVSECV